MGRKKSVKARFFGRKRRPPIGAPKVFVERQPAIDAMRSAAEAWAWSEIFNLSEEAHEQRRS